MYEITIKKLVTVTKPESSDYKKVSDTGGDDGGAKYDYVKKPPYEVQELQIKFQQQADDVDILATIAAFNGVTFNK